MLVWLTLPFYDFCGFRSVAVNSVYKLQFFTFILVYSSTNVGTVKCLKFRLTMPNVVSGMETSSFMDHSRHCKLEQKWCQHFSVYSAALHGGCCVPPCVADVSIVNCAVCHQFNKQTLLLLLIPFSSQKIGNNVEACLRQPFCEVDRHQVEFCCQQADQVMSWRASDSTCYHNSVPSSVFVGLFTVND